MTDIVFYRFVSFRHWSCVIQFLLPNKNFFRKKENRKYPNLIKIYISNVNDALKMWFIHFDCISSSSSFLPNKTNDQYDNPDESKWKLEETFFFLNLIWINSSITPPIKKLKEGGECNCYCGSQSVNVRPLTLSSSSIIIKTHFLMMILSLNHHHTFAK